MSYNILNKNVKFQGATQGTVEDIVDTHSDQQITGSKDFQTLTGSNAYVKNNLGIGTATPSEKLTINTGNIQLTNGYQLQWGDSQVGIFGNTASDYVRLKTSGLDRLTVDSTGKVGIGTINPNSKLQVDGNITATHLSCTNVTASGTVTVTGTISGSGAISGSAFFGDGSNLSGVGVSLASNSGLEEASGLRVNPSTAATLAGSIADADSILIFSTADSAPKKATVAQVASRATVPVSTYTNVGGTANRLIASIDSSGVIARTNLTFDNTDLLLTGNMSGSGTLQFGGTVAFNGLDSNAANASQDDVLFIDATTSRVTKTSFSNFAAVIAGAGIINNSGVLDVEVSGAMKLASDKVGISGSIAGNGLSFSGGDDSISSLAVNLQPNSGLAVDASGVKLSMNGLPTATPAPASDSITFIDSDGDKKCSFSTFLTAIAGTGLGVNNSQLTASGGGGGAISSVSAGADNRIATFTSSDALSGEANLTFDGSLLTVAGTGSATRLRANYAGGGHTDAVFLISGSNTETLFQIMQQGNGYPTAFLAGENHSTYPGLLYNRGKLANGGAISQGNLEGANGSHTRLTIRKTSIADNTATNVVTFTIPNANHAASIRVTGLANYDACNYAQVFSFEGVIARGSGSPTDKSFSAVSVTESANIGGGQEFSIAVAGSSNSGGNTDTQTFTLQFTIDTDTGSSSNATIMIELINFNDSGITMAAS